MNAFLIKEKQICIQLLHINLFIILPSSSSYNGDLISHISPLEIGVIGPVVQSVERDNGKSSDIITVISCRLCVYFCFNTIPPDTCGDGSGGEGWEWGMFEALWAHPKCDLRVRFPRLVMPD